MPMIEEHGYQIPLPDPKKGPENFQKIVHFAAETVIYIEGRQPAVLQDKCFAEPTGKKRGRLSEYIAQSRLDLYFNTRFWSMPVGTMFTAYKNMAHKL